MGRPRRLAGWLGLYIQSVAARRPPGETAFLVLVPVIGVFTGLTALGISYLIAGGQALFWRNGGDLLALASAAPFSTRILVPALGGALVGLLGWALRSEGRTQGTAGIIQALALKGGEVSLAQTLPRVAAGILTVSCGGSLGREGPIINFAAAVGSRLGRTLQLPPQRLRVLVCCAAASAIAAVYNAPVGGTIFAMEILIGNFALEIFGPVVISSVLATLIFRTAMGNLPRFVIPQYELISSWEIPACVLLGVITGIFSLVFIRGLFLFEDFFRKLPLPAMLKPVLGFALLGLLGCWVPQVYGNGYESTNLTLHDAMPLGLLLVLPLAKLLATALTSGSGGSGGLFTPSMMMGALVGGLYGDRLHAWLPSVTADPGVYALVGMGGVVAGTTHAPITAVMMMFEQTDSYPIILPLMLVCIVSTLTARALHGESLHHEQLLRRGVVLPSSPEASVMHNTRVRDLMHEEIDAVVVTAPFREVVERFLRSPRNFLYVVDKQGAFAGAIPLHALKSTLQYAEKLPMVIAHDLMDPFFEFVTPEQPLAETMEKFWRQSSERLPVVADASSRKLVGWVSKRDLIGIYNQEILRKRQVLARFTSADKEWRGDVYVELPEGVQIQSVTVAPAAEGVSLRDLAPLPGQGVLVLQIKRRDPASGIESILMPKGESCLQAGDRLSVIGTVENIGRFQEALARRGPALTQAPELSDNASGGPG